MDPISYTILVFFVEVSIESVSILKLLINPKCEKNITLLKILSGKTVINTFAFTFLSSSPVLVVTDAQQPSNFEIPFHGFHFVYPSLSTIANI